MKTCTHVSNKHHLILSAVFYYAVLLVLIIFGATLGYWQAEQDSTPKVFTKTKETIPKGSNDFFVGLDFCLDGESPVTLEKYFFNVNTKTLYSQPISQFTVDSSKCLKTKIFEKTGKLPAGKYEYHVSATYRLNPIREVTKKVAVIELEIE